MKSRLKHKFELLSLYRHVTGRVSGRLSGAFTSAFFSGRSLVPDNGSESVVRVSAGKTSRTSGTFLRWLRVPAVLLLLGTGVSTVQSQHYLGVRGGWGGGSARFKPAEETGIEWGMLSGGISYKFFTEAITVGGIQADLQYIGKGYQYDTRINGDTSYHRTFSAVELPFMWQPHFYLFQRRARVFVNLGVHFSYHFGGEEWYESREKGVFGKQDYDWKRTRDNRLGYGLFGGGGLSMLTGRFDVTLEARYYFGFSDILKNVTKYETNPTKSPLDQINISLGVYYRLGKDGIRSAPTAKVAAKIAEAEARRMAKKGISPEPVIPDSLLKEWLSNDWLDDLEIIPTDAGDSTILEQEVLNPPEHGAAEEPEDLPGIVRETVSPGASLSNQPVSEPEKEGPPESPAAGPESNTPAENAAEPRQTGLLPDRVVP